MNWSHRRARPFWLNWLNRLARFKDSRLEDKEWEDAAAWDAKARQRCAELGMTVVDPTKDEIEKARKLARAGWDIWLTRTGADGKRGMDLALKALGR